MNKQRKRNENTINIMKDDAQPWKTLEMDGHTMKRVNCENTMSRHNWKTRWETIKRNLTKLTQWEHNESAMQNHDKLWTNNARMGAKSLRFLTFLAIKNGSWSTESGMERVRPPKTLSLYIFSIPMIILIGLSECQQLIWAWVYWKPTFWQVGQYKICRYIIAYGNRCNGLAL